MEISKTSYEDLGKVPKSWSCPFKIESIYSNLSMIISEIHFWICSRSNQISQPLQHGTPMDKKIQ